MVGVCTAPIILRERYRVTTDCCNDYVSLILAHIRVTLLFRPHPALQTHCLRDYSSWTRTFDTRIPTDTCPYSVVKSRPAVSRCLAEDLLKKKKKKKKKCHFTYSDLYVKKKKNFKFVSKKEEEQDGGNVLRESFDWTVRGEYVGAKGSVFSWGYARGCERFHFVNYHWALVRMNHSCPLRLALITPAGKTWAFRIVSRDYNAFYANQLVE